MVLVKRKRICIGRSSGDSPQIRSYGKVSSATETFIRKDYKSLVHAL
jgi:hypothetical protein